MGKRILLGLGIIVIVCFIFNFKGGDGSKNKTAILIFGQPRTYKKCYKSLFDNIINQNNDHNFDIYLITWKKDYNEELLKYYKPKDVLLLDYDDFLKDLDTIDKIKIGLNYQNANKMGNHKDINTYFVQMWQWYKGYQFVKQKNYDYIVRTRFDNFFNKPIIINNNIFMRRRKGGKNLYKNGNYMIDDIFFIVKKNEPEIFKLWNNQNKLDFINVEFIKNYTNKLEWKDEYLIDLETLVTIYVKDYRKYDHKLLDDKTIKLIR